VMARTDPVLINSDHMAGTARIELVYAVEVALLQASTIIGVAVCGVAGAALAAGMIGRRGYERMIVLVGSRTRRTALQLAAVLLTLLVWLGVTSAAVAATAIAQAARLGLSVPVEFGSWSILVDDFAKTALVSVVFASAAITVGLVLARTPLVAALSLVGGAFSLLVIEQLTESIVAGIVPTAWIAEFLQLPLARFGTAFYWTTGATGGMRSLTWLLMFSLALAALLILWFQNRRIERG